MSELNTKKQTQNLCKYSSEVKKVKMFWMVSRKSTIQTFLEDDLGWKTNFDGRQAWVKDDCGWNTTLDGREPWMNDDHGWKTTLDG